MEVKVRSLTWVLGFSTYSLNKEVHGLRPEKQEESLCVTIGTLLN